MSRKAGVPTVSVIIPALNAAPYIRMAIDSVLAQTHPVLEVIVVDGGSKDGTQALVAAYGEPVRLLDLTVTGRKGIGEGRNFGVEAAAGEWVAFLDADDWWDSRKIASQVAALEKCPDAALCYTGVCLVYEQSGERKMSWARDPSLIWPSLRWSNQVGTSTVVVRRSALQEIGAFREDLKVFEDWDLWVRLRLRYSFASCSEPLSFYRVLEQGASHDVRNHLEAIALCSRGAMVEGLSGWRRWLVRRRLWATQLYGAALTSREKGAPQAKSFLWRSLASWPLPTFLPIRYKVLLSILIKPGAGGKQGV